jgi:gas vesicle protein
VLTEFLGSDAGQSWLQSLLGGLLGALVGALVALFVLQRTLRNQREENVRSRRRDSAAALLTNVWELADSIQPKPRFARDYVRVFADITINVERLHLDISQDEADFYHAVSALLSEVNAHVRSASKRGRIRLSDSDRDDLVGIIGLLGSVIAEWVRAPQVSVRKEYAEGLVGLLGLVRAQGLKGWRVLDQTARGDRAEELLKRHSAKIR